MGNTLIMQQRQALVFDRYYNGDSIPLIVLEDYCDVFGEFAPFRPLLQPPKINVCRMGVDAPVERLIVNGFQVGDAAESSTDGAQQVDALWKGNDLDLMAPVAFTESFIKRRSFFLVAPGTDGRAVISVEDATQMVVHRQSAPPYGVDAAFKVDVDEWTGLTRGRLWCNGAQWELSQSPSGAWSIIGDEPEPLAPTLGDQIPVVEMSRRPRLLGEPISAIEDVMALSDTFTFLVAQMAIAATFGAIPVRTATGIKLPRLRDSLGNVMRDSEGNELLDPAPPFDIRADRLLASESKDASFGTLPAADLAGYVAATGMISKQIRGATGVPEHYYEGAPAGVSSETLKAAEANLVRRVIGDQPWGAQALRKAVQYGLLIDGSPYALAPLAVQWADPETRVPSQQIDAAQKLVGMGVPLEFVLTKELGYSVQEIEKVNTLIEQGGQQIAALIHDARRDVVGAVGTQFDTGTPPAGGGDVPGLVHATS